MLGIHYNLREKSYGCCSVERMREYKWGGLKKRRENEEKYTAND